MSERQHHVESSPKPNPELEAMAAKAEQLRSVERSGEKIETREKAVETAQEQLRRVEQARPAEEAAPTAEPVAPRGIFSQAANYRQTMVSLQHRMKPAARSFSKFIHTPVIEKTSEVVGQTVLRPSVSLGATTTAVVVTGFVYLYARSQGFVMRGSVVWIALIVGGIAGLLLEGAYRMVQRLNAR